MKTLWSAKLDAWSQDSAIMVTCAATFDNGRKHKLHGFVSASEWTYGSKFERRYLLTACVRNLKKIIEAMNNENRT